jgi:hypothetical protein
MSIQEKTSQTISCHEAESEAGAEADSSPIALDNSYDSVHVQQELRFCNGCIMLSIPDVFVASNIEIEHVSQRAICSGLLEDGSELMVEMPVHSLVAIALRHSAQFVKPNITEDCPTDN